jgi:RecA-family ATPase
MNNRNLTQGLQRELPKGFFITFGKGVTENQGRRVEVEPKPILGDDFSGDVIGAYVEKLNQYVGVEAWYTLNLFKGDTRQEDQWIASYGISVDVDYFDPAASWVNPAKVEHFKAARDKAGKLICTPEEAVDLALDSHCPMPAQLANKVDELAGSSDAFPANIYYRTERGFRAINIFDTPITDANLYEKAQQGLAARFQEYLQKHGIIGKQVRSGDRVVNLASGYKRLVKQYTGNAGLIVDPVTVKKNQLYFTPRATVRGVARVASAVPLNTHPTGVAGLLEWSGRYVEQKDEVPTPATPTPVAKPVVKAPAPAAQKNNSQAKRPPIDPEEDGEAYGEYLEARRLFNADYLATNGPWPKGGAVPCFACGTLTGFGMNKLKPEQWYCFSTNHPDACGHTRIATKEFPEKAGETGGYCGDALEKVMWENGWTQAGMKETEALFKLRDADGEPYYDGRHPDEKRWEELTSAFRRFTRQELTEEPKDLEFLWGEILPVGKNSIFMGTGAVGKSAVMTGLALHRAHGLPFLGWNVKPGGTLVLTGEDGLEDYRRRIFAWKAFIPGFDVEKVEKNFVVADVAGIENIELVEVKFGVNNVSSAVRDYIAFIKKFPECDHVVVETASRFGTSEDNEGYKTLGAAIDRISKKAKVTVTLIVHKSKNSTREGDNGAHSARGGSSLTDNARAGMYVSGIHKNNREELGLGKFDEEFLKTLLVIGPNKPNFQIDQTTILVEKVKTKYKGGMVVRRFYPENAANCETMNGIRSDKKYEEEARALVNVIVTLRDTMKVDPEDITETALTEKYPQTVKELIQYVKVKQIPDIVGHAVRLKMVERVKRKKRGGGEYLAIRPEFDRRPVANSGKYAGLPDTGKLNT